MFTRLNEKRFSEETGVFPFARIREPGAADPSVQMRRSTSAEKFQNLCTLSSSFDVLHSEVKAASWARRAVSNRFRYGPLSSVNGEENASLNEGLRHLVV